jgi:hypothetical protein
MTSVKIEGFAALEKELNKLSKVAGKSVLRRSLKIAAMPMKDMMQDLAPRGDTASDDLADSIAIGSKLSKRQAGLHRKMFRDDRAAIELFVGPGPDPAAWNQEFGNVHHGAQPFARPAWDQEAQPTLDRLGRHLWDEFDKSLQRAKRKAAKE